MYRVLNLPLYLGLFLRLYSLRDEFFLGVYRNFSCLYAQNWQKRRQNPLLRMPVEIKWNNNNNNKNGEGRQWLQ